MLERRHMGASCGVARSTASLNAEAAGAPPGGFYHLVLFHFCTLFFELSSPFQ